MTDLIEVDQGQIDMGFPASPELGSLVRDPAHEAVEGTYTGMAHIAGTGPDGSLCCHCTRFGNMEGNPVKRFGFRAGTLKPGTLKPGYCHRFVHGKRFQMFPANAKACSLIEPMDEPRVYRKEAPKAEVKTDG